MTPEQIAEKLTSDHVFVPRDAPEAMWDGLPRAMMMWLDFDRPTPRKLFDHLRMSGIAVPDWMREEGEMKALDHVPSKGTRCVLIYRAMIENWLALGLTTTHTNRSMGE